MLATPRVIRKRNLYSLLGAMSAQRSARRRVNGPGGGGPSGTGFGTARSTARQTTLRSGVGVTTQNDRSRVYRKRYMNRRMKRRIRRFRRKVLSVSEKDLGTRTVVFNTQIAQGNVTVNTDNVLCVSLYGLRSTTLDFNNDLFNISNLENTSLAPTAAVGNLVQRTAKFLFKSAILDVTFVNRSLLNLGGGQTFDDPRGTLELDIYEIVCNQDFATAGQLYGGLANALNNETNQELTIGGATAPAANIQIQRRGVTPFDCSTAQTRLKIKILKKTKYFIPQHGTVTYQMRDKKRRMVLSRQINDESGANMVGWTKWLLYNYKLVPGLPLGSEPQTWQCIAQVGVTRKYMYKVEGINEKRSYHLNQSASVSSPV